MISSSDNADWSSSAKAIEALKRAGFEGRLINLKGGISAWSDDVDPSVAKYTFPPRTVLDAKGEWIPAVLQAADTRLTQLRNGGVPDAGAMVIASDQKAARAYAAALTKLTTTQVTALSSTQVHGLTASQLNAISTATEPLSAKKAWFSSPGNSAAKRAARR